MNKNSIKHDVTIHLSVIQPGHSYLPKRYSVVMVTVSITWHQQVILS